MIDNLASHSKELSIPASQEAGKKPAKITRRHGIALLLAATTSLDSACTFLAAGTNNDSGQVSGSDTITPTEAPTLQASPTIRPTTIVITHEQQKQVAVHAEAVAGTLHATFRPEILKQARPDSRIAKILHTAAEVKKHNGDFRAADGLAVLYAGYWIKGGNPKPGELGFSYEIDPTEFDFKDPELKEVFTRAEDDGFNIELATNYVNMENVAKMGLPQRWYLRLKPHSLEVDLSKEGHSRVRRFADKMLLLRGPKGEIGNWAMSTMVPNPLYNQTQNGYHRIHLSHHIFSEGNKNPKTGEASNYTSLSVEATDFGQLTVNFRQ